jgi:hypothetical protein
MSKFFLRVFLCIFWFQFRLALRSVLGFKKFSDSCRAEALAEEGIRFQNSLWKNEAGNPKLTWGNTSKTDRVEYARYVTMRELNAIGNMLVILRAVQYPRIKESLEGAKDGCGRGCKED